jgi:protein SCO1/2
LLAIAARAWAGDHDFGPVTPRVLPDFAATRQDGSTIKLHALFSGKPTVVQFIFTQCRTVCPLLGSLFSKVDRELGAGTQLVSISVDPASDTPVRLAEWLKAYRASGRWTALRLARRDLARLLAAFDLKAGAPAAHSMQAFLVDGEARFVNRTTALPSASEVLRMTGLSREGNEPVDASATACANCHGADFRGGREGATIVPPLTRHALLSSLPRRGGPPSAYDEASFCVSLRTGADPAGVAFSNVMPRYNFDAASCAALWARLTLQHPAGR